MNKKTVMLIVGLTLTTALLTAGLTIAGVNMLTPRDGQGATSLTRLFSKQTASKIAFVEMPPVVISLQGKHSEVRYMLLEIALIAHNADRAEQTAKMVPALQGATVNLLSGQPFDDIRGRAIDTLTAQLKAAYTTQLQQLKTPAPFDEVIISKVVFQ